LSFGRTVRRRLAGRRFADRAADAAAAAIIGLAAGRSWTGCRRHRPL